MGGVVLRTQQALLLGGDRQEQHRTLRALGLGEAARQLDQRGGTAGIVQRTVEDAVTARIRRAHTDVVPVRAVDDRLVRMAAAFQARGHIVRAAPG
ncbi:hypothetical protein G6F64_014976 [Rhizopus arrhizus]|uniref:Uncharacterized protein n=1 Tax=Rhizopus oryzae TaxID=64495 RepID=A0A9P6WSF0_RHIOR|nr:hypothetical protein G6F64_014976 [Rhizopus arrhizus]